MCTSSDILSSTHATMHYSCTVAVGLWCVRCGLLAPTLHLTRHSTFSVGPMRPDNARTPMMNVFGMVLYHPQPNGPHVTPLTLRIFADYFRLYIQILGQLVQHLTRRALSLGGREVEPSRGHVVAAYTGGLAAMISHGRPWPSVPTAGGAPGAAYARRRHLAPRPRISRPPLAR